MEKEAIIEKIMEMGKSRGKLTYDEINDAIPSEYSSPEEIEELADKVKAESKDSTLLFAFFNNHWRGYAPRNAVDMKKSLGLPFEELPTKIPPEE